MDNVAESPWANSLIIEKIYSNLAPWDRKMLKITVGKSEEVRLLCKKADELLALNEDVVGSLNQEGVDRPWNSQTRPTVVDARNNRQYYPQSRGHNGRQNQGENGWQNDWQNQRKNGWQWQYQPAGRKRRDRPKRYQQPPQV